MNGAWELGSPASLLDGLEKAVAGLTRVPVPDSGEAAMQVADRLGPLLDRLDVYRSLCVRRVDVTGAAKVARRSSTSAWLTENGKLSQSGAGRCRRVGRELERLPRVTAAALAGQLSAAMVDQICRATKLFKKNQDVSVVEDALLGLAVKTRDLDMVAKAGGHLHQVLNPDGNLSRHEKAYRKRHLSIRGEEDGGISGFFYLPPEPAAQLRHMLDTYAKPAGANGQDQRSQAQRNADALIALLEGAVKTQMIVLVSAETLPDDRQPEHSEHPEPGQSNDSQGQSDDSQGQGDGEGEIDRDRLAADERVDEAWSRLRGPDPPRQPCPSCRQHPRRDIPAVMLSTGVLLPAPHTVRRMRTSTLYRLICNATSIDTSAGVRLVPERFRRPVLARYSTCAYDDCPIPAKYCEFDHAFDWTTHKRTHADEIVPACDFHNRDRWNHPTTYKLHRLPDGRLHFRTHGKHQER